MLRTLLSGLPVIQVAVAVHDPEACAERQSAILGNGGWTSTARDPAWTGAGKLAYLDTHATLGMIFEVIEQPTSLGEPARRL